MNCFLMEGEVLNVTATGKMFKAIRKNILKNIKKINWQAGF